MASPSHLENALAALADIERDAGLPGVPSGSVYTAPPGNLGALPAVVNVLASAEYEEPGFGDVVVGLQRETATLQVLVLTGADTEARAQAVWLPVLEGLRLAVNGHKDLSGTCRLVRTVSWRAGVMDYAGQPYHGLALTLEARFDVAGEYGV